MRISLPKCPTGVKGLDEITEGGLPAGRATLVCGAAGSGKTLLGFEFLLRGIAEYGEPGVCVTFEETAQDLITNAATMGFDAPAEVSAGKLVIDHILIERNQIEETGEYDLEGLFIRLGHAIDSIGAKRVLLDTIEALFAGLSDQGVLRAELRRLLLWLKQKGVTTILTGERMEERLTRHGLEEYVSDCVILLDQKVEHSVSTRRLRVVKYRGSSHGTNDYPFLIGDDGFSVLPITSLQLTYSAQMGRVSTGVAGLDAMLNGRQEEGGYYRGSTVLISGGAGTGKSIVAALFCDHVCRRGDRAVYFAFEESPDQIRRNMGSVGVDLNPWMSADLLRVVAIRPTMMGLESHLVRMHRTVSEFDPRAVVLDPISSFTDIAPPREVLSMVTRLSDYLKHRGITTLMTHQTRAGTAPESTEADVSSMVDTWILLRDSESGGERNRAIYVLKSRGMPHSNQVREFVISDNGIEIMSGANTGGLVGSARMAQHAADIEARERRQQAIERKQRDLAQKRRMLEAQIAGVRAGIEEDETELEDLLRQEPAATAPPPAPGRESTRNGNNENG
jgi:circadian clock protein KaiC